MADEDLIQRLEIYYDSVPRSRATVEEVGPFTLFVATSGWPYYARPSIDATIEISSDDVNRVLARQRELGVPQAIEWVDEVTPGLAETIESMGIGVARCPLLVLDGGPRGDSGTATMLDPADEAAIRQSRAAIGVAFANGGTATGLPGLDERDARQADDADQVDADFLGRAASGELRLATVVPADGRAAGAVGGGSYVAVDGVAELAGIGVLPAYRQRGLAAAVTHALAADALDRGATTVFCSAASDDVARVYEGIGFRRVATACIVAVE